jgi:hypothetical protein
MSRKEDLPERLSEELNDTERTLLSLAPRASRIDRDRLMIALGEQTAARSATPWKWATGASLALALALGVRSGFDAPAVAPRPIATRQDAGEEPRASDDKTSQPVESPEVAEPARATSDDFDWLRALASGQFDSSRPLTVRPEFTQGETALRGAEVAVRDETEKTQPAARTPMLRWGDERLRRGEGEWSGPRT